MIQNSFHVTVDVADIEGMHNVNVDAAFMEQNFETKFFFCSSWFPVALFQKYKQGMGEGSWIIPALENLVNGTLVVASDF